MVTRRGRQSKETLHAPVAGVADPGYTKFSPCCARREFLRTAGLIAAAFPLWPGVCLGSAAEGEVTPRKKETTRIAGAFLYPPSETLRKAGYWSWPGSAFDAEGRQRQYSGRLGEVAKTLGVQLAFAEKALDDADSVGRYIAQVKETPPDGLLLVPFKKSHWPAVVRIVEETRLPSIVLATLGVVLVEHINQLHRAPGVYLINSLEDFAAVGYGLRMIRTARWMKDSRLLNITGQANATRLVPHLGTEVRTVPHARFVDEFRRQEVDDAVKALAESYRKNAREIVQPTAEDILEAAKTYFVYKRLLAAEQADAVMMECLTGLQIPHQHVPPCLGFMSLRDEGIPAGCQADLDATLTLMLVEQLFEQPGFQQNASMDTEKNLYFGAHCTAPSKMRGRSAPPEPYVLMNHAEAGWGCVPRVLFTAGQDATMALYRSGEKPQMLVYSGKIVGCPPIPPAGGCRSNLQMTINEVADVCEVKGMHQIIFYGNHVRPLRAFCQLYGLEAVT